MEKIDNFYAITEGSDTEFYKVRNSISSFIRHNDWFTGTILVIMFDQISNHNIRILDSIYPDIKILKLNPGDIAELSSKISKKNNKVSLLDFVYMYSFKLKSKGNLYFSRDTIFLREISDILSTDSVTAPIKYDIFPNTNPAITDIDPSLMFVPESYINIDIFNTLYNSTVISNVFNLNEKISTFNKFLKSKDLKVRQLSDTFLTKSSMFPDSKYKNFIRLHKQIHTILMNTSNVGKSGFNRIHSYWKNINANVNIYLQKPSSRRNINRDMSKGKESVKLTKKSNVDESKFNISVIIPAYKAELYIKECIDSVINQNTEANIEILIGIDNCLTTLDEVNKISKHYSNVNIYFNESQSGPYIIRNSLVDKAKYDNILFFDADDIMKEDLISTILSYYTKNSPIRFKYLDFSNSMTYKTSNRPHHKVAHGVFFINLDLLNRIGGFQPWMCGADSEFMKRCVRNRIKDVNVQDYLFYRRIHANSLTQHSGTNHRSKVRDVAKRFITTNRDWSIPINKKVIELKKL